MSFKLYYKNKAAGFHTPNNLDPDAGTPTEPNRNQQYRVDVMKRGAPVDSVKKRHVLANVFRTEVGDPLKLKPTLITFDLTPFAGKKVRIRFAEVDNQGQFLASVDKVKVKKVATGNNDDDEDED